MNGDNGNKKIDLENAGMIDAVLQFVKERGASTIAFHECGG